MTAERISLDGRVVRAVTFDATGTLFHSPRLGEIYSEVLTRHGVTVSAKEALDLIGRVWVEFDCAAEPQRDRFAAHPGGARGWWRDFLGRFGSYLNRGEVSPFAVSELYERFSQAEAWEVFGEVPGALARLSGAGLALGVVSNWDERLPVVLNRLGLSKWLSAVSYSQAVGVEKPHERIFRDALAKLAVRPGEAVHVGDRVLQDVEGAEGVGMYSVHLDRKGESGRKSRRRRRPVCVASDLGDVLRRMKLA